ncbi:MAG: hypothetical protein JWQ87_1272 [Candidatus Sulfotelmatobacter sp.]|nr:hypothetical protein [Candidatus Sulfotelmatobacter sp.]
MSPRISVRIPNPKRLRFVFLAWGMILLGSVSYVRAQEDGGDTPLGDVARSFRKKTPPVEAVVDNDNLSKVVDDAESRRAAGASPVFSLEPGGKNFHVCSPDVTCSLSFSAKTSSLLSDPLLLDELPRSELAKLDGPATIDGDSLQVSVHNGTTWELREVVIGLTIVKRSEFFETGSYLGQAHIVPAAGVLSPQNTLQKQPDATFILRVKGSAAPSATALFRTALNFALFPDQDWHWAIVKAKGIPPLGMPGQTITQAGPGSPVLGPMDKAQSPFLEPNLSNSPIANVPLAVPATDR